MADTNSLQLSVVEGKPFPECTPTLWEAFVDSATQYPDSPAISSVQQLGTRYGLPNIPLEDDEYQSSPYLRWSYREFSTAVARIANGLADMGLKEGSIIFSFLPNCAEFSVAMWAAMCLGCKFVPVHPRTLLNKEEVTHITTLCVDTGHGNKHTMFVGNDDMAKQAQALNLTKDISLIVLETASSANELTAFSDLMEKSLQLDHSALDRDNPMAARSHVILFTSGTTALPKGCVFDAFGWNLWCQNRLDSVPVTTNDCCLLTVPNNHAFFFLYEVPFRTVGAHTVIPAPSFSPHATMEVILREKCTHLAMSPTMIHAIVQVLDQTHSKLPSLKNVTSGGSKISPEFLNSCLENLGSAGVENIYGTSEGGVCASTRVVSNVAEVTRNGDIAVGRVAMGASSKVCAVGSRDPLPCGIEGELHFSAPMMCKGYLGTGFTEDFYEDESGRVWFATGDAATINEEGLIFIVGRLKDMIIRGGVNISPAAIEFVLQNDATTKSFNIQIVSIPDAIAGEVPVAVSEKPLTLEQIDLVIDAVLRNMGPVFVPEQVFNLGDLGLQDFPKTTSTKHKKGALQRTVRDYIKQRDLVTLQESDGYSEMTRKMQKIWTRTIGHAVDTHVNVTEFADSITLMRVRDRIEKEIGVAIPLADMLVLKTVEDEIQLVQEKQKDKTISEIPVAQVNGTTYVNKSGTSSGPTSADIVHLRNQPELYDSTRAYIESEIGKHGLSWDDVESVFPSYDYMQVLLQADILNESWSWKFCCLANKGITKEEMRQGVEQMLSNNLALTSFIFWNRTAFGQDLALHVVPQASDKLFKAIFEDLGSVATKDEFAKMSLRPYEFEYATLPGPLIKCFMLDVVDEDRVGCLMCMHHAPMDASYMQHIFDDLDMALGFSKPLQPHISWKTWSDSYYSLRTSHEAQLAVSWHVKRLNNLVECKPAVFPPLPKIPTRIQPTDDNGYHTNFEATGLTNLRRKYPYLAAPTVLKTAWCLMNLNRNNHDYAIFTNLQADRKSFPFIPDALKKLAPPDAFSASDVQGMLLQDVINIIPLIPGETLIEFMTRIHLEQEELNKYPAAPMKQIMSGIGGVNSEIYLDVLRSQIFNWTTGLGAMEQKNLHENYEPIAGAIRPSIRLVINVDVSGPRDETVYMQIKSPLFDEDGLVAIADEVEDFTRWLVDEKNWETKTGSFRDALRANTATTNGERIQPRSSKTQIF